MTERFFFEYAHADQYVVVEGSPPAVDCRTVGVFFSKEDAEAVCEFMNGNLERASQIHREFISTIPMMICVDPPAAAKADDDIPF